MRPVLSSQSRWIIWELIRFSVARTSAYIMSAETRRCTWRAAREPPLRGSSVVLACPSRAIAIALLSSEMISLNAEPLWALAIWWNWNSTRSEEMM